MGQKKAGLAIFFTLSLYDTVNMIFLE